MQPKQGEAPRPEPGAGARVLVVDDEPAILRFLKPALEANNYDVAHAATVAEAIKRIAADAPDIVLLDLVLLGPDGKPSADGFQMCREIKRTSQNRIKVVVVSAKGDEDSAEWALMQGADAFLQKPFAVEDLISVMQQMVPKQAGG